MMKENTPKEANPDVLILIPARYQSSRFPGKPLAKIAGKTMLKRVYDIAYSVKLKLGNINILIATEDQRIVDYCNQENLPVILTSESCQSGTERAFEAVKQTPLFFKFILNLQGDNALCPPWFIEALIEEYRKAPNKPQVLTPYVNLSWQELDELRTIKSQTPFSGTTVVCKRNGEALWFSKQIIPAIRNEAILRSTSKVSPIKRHIGIYGYHREILEKIPDLTPSEYADQEGLEQLNFLENNIYIQMIEVSYRDKHGMSGIDSPEDVARAEQIILEDGELI